MIEAQVIGSEHVARTARVCAREYGLLVSRAPEARHLHRLLPPASGGLHASFLWCASLRPADLPALREHIARLRDRRPGVVLVGLPSRPPGPVTRLLSSRPTGRRATREMPRADRLPAELGASVIEVTGGPHSGLRRFLRCFAGALMQARSITRVTPLALADLLSEPVTGHLLFWRAGADAAGRILLRPSAGALPALRDPRATAALIHLRCPDRMPLATVQETASAVEEMVTPRADALLTTATTRRGNGDIEVHAAVFRPSLQAHLEAALHRRGQHRPEAARERAAAVSPARTESRAGEAVATATTGTWPRER